MLKAKLVYLDCFSGISGDMFLGALLDAGVVEKAFLEEKLGHLGLGKVKLSLKRVKRAALLATHLLFEFPADETHHRDFREIRDLIEKSGLQEAEKRRALEIFRHLAEAEAKIHGVSVEEVHFHEVGALDSIYDIVGAAVAIEALAAERYYISKINLGSGSIETQHGLLPVPAPATLELLKGFPTYSSGVEAELTTPTGAAILRHLAPEYGLPPARWESIGYGAGTQQLKTPNVLRVFVGEALSHEGGWEHQEALVIEADIDDMNPELLPHVRERLFQAGAQDVSWHPLQMKKGRTGFRLCVLSPPEDIDKLCEVVFRETTTLGVRIHRVEKRFLERKIVRVETPYGAVRVKLGLFQGEVLNVAPEYEDCVQLAAREGVPLKEVMRVAGEYARQELP